jgi:hypothetical protein
VSTRWCILEAVQVVIWSFEPLFNRAFSLLDSAYDYVMNQKNPLLQVKITHTPPL